MRTMSWPSQSPDMNIIESVWQLLEVAMDVRPKKPPSLPSLFAALCEKWAKISQESIRALVYTMPKRVAELKKMKGMHSHY